MDSLRCFESSFLSRWICPALLLATLLLHLSVSTAPAVSQAEHESHHPDQFPQKQAADAANPPSGTVGGAAGMGAGAGMGGMGGKGAGSAGMGGMGGADSQIAGKGMMGAGAAKGGMMGDGKRGKGKGTQQAGQLYPRLMSLPAIDAGQREQMLGLARERMLDGTALLSEGLDELSDAAAKDDLSRMHEAAVKLRQGVMVFETGLAAEQAIAQGKAPRNLALQWFKREMNLLPPAIAKSGFRWFGMSAFHTFIMALMLLFSASMIWMYFFKMRRAAQLMEALATAAASNGASASAAAPAAVPPPDASTASASAQPAKQKEKAAAGAADCCDESAGAPAAIADGAGGQHDISTGLLPLTKKKLCRLRVARIYQETPDVKTFRMVSCHGGGIPFSYLPGQFLTLTLPVAGKPIRRSYTISSSPTQGYYCEITVKREEQGAGSRYLHDQVKAGDTIEAQAPSGKFFFTGKESDSIVLIAGGVGITPMMSVTRALTDMGWDGDIYFIVACSDPQHFIFEAELKRLRERHPNLHVFVAMSRIQEDQNGYKSGRLSKELLSQWVANLSSRRIHICGPPKMMDGVREMLAELRVPPGNIHTENFGAAQKPHVKAAERSAAASTPLGATAVAATATFQASGKSTQFQPGETVLEAAERVDVDIASSCRVGMCGVCTVKLLAGKVEMETEDGLDEDDRAAGMVLACQAKANEDVTVDA